MSNLKLYLFLLIAGLGLSSCSSSDEDDDAPEMLWSVSVESSGNITTSVDPDSHYPIQIVVDGNSCEATLKCSNYKSLVFYDNGKELDEYEDYECRYVATVTEAGTVKLVFDKMPDNSKGSHFYSFLTIDGFDGDNSNSTMVEIQRKH